MDPVCDAQGKHSCTIVLRVSLHKTGVLITIQPGPESSRVP